MPRDIRRVVTGHDEDGRSRVVIDETMTPDMGHVLTPQGRANVRLSDIWICDRVPTDNAGNEDTVANRVTLEPPAGGIVFRTVEIPPDSERNFDTMREYFDAMGAGARLDGKQHPGMHKTNTVDFLVIVSGEIWMLLDEGEVHLKAGDTCVQRGTLHAWSNRSDKPCLLAGTLVDANALPASP
jgi:mannose-6-phosphate isomerase-like protein (cupin superfamily)